MTDETDTLPDEGGTDNVETHQDDTFSEWNDFDPDEEQDTEEAPAEEETAEDEGGETEDNPDEAEAEEEPEDKPEETTAEAEHDAKVRLSDGTETTVGDLIKGHMRQSDYTRKAQELANSRKSLEADASRMESITTAFVDHLAKLMPPEPDEQLIYSDPAKFSQQKAIYDQSLAQIQKLVELGSAPKEITQKMSEEDRRQTLSQENARLVEMFPETGTQKGRQQFFGEVEAAANELGFTSEELQSVSDHRVFALAHWAKKGMEAEKARKSAKAKVEAASKAPPRKPGSGAKAPDRRKQARQALAKDDSIENAIRLFAGK